MDGSYNIYEKDWKIQKLEHFWESFMRIVRAQRPRRDRGVSIF